MLDRSIRDLGEMLQVGDLWSYELAENSILSAVRSLNDLLPSELKRPRGAFRELQKHARLVKLYSGRGNLDNVRGNTTALRTDMVRLRAELAPHTSESEGTSPVNVEELPASSAKNLLREAVMNYTSGTYGSAIVSAVNALESYLRWFRETKMGIDSTRGRLDEVMDDLERGGQLTKTEAPLALVLRLYRDSSADPSEFTPTRDETHMVIQFVFSKLKSRPR